MHISVRAKPLRRSTCHSWHRPPHATACWTEAVNSSDDDSVASNDWPHKNCLINSRCEIDDEADDPEWLELLRRPGILKHHFKETEPRCEALVDLERFQRLLQRMERSGVASLSQLVGCSEQEVAALEARYRLHLPEAYRVYLRVMGHNSGRLFTCDHMAVFYRYVLEMTAEQRQIWAESNAEDGSGPPPSFDFPADGLLIAGRLGDQFEFIRCHGEDDSPVWYFNDWDWQVRESKPSVFAWLETWCEEAERAIASGYFNRFPGGTTP